MDTLFSKFASKNYNSGDTTYQISDARGVVGVIGEFVGHATGPIDLIAATQGFTGPFTDVGGEVDCSSYNCGAIFLDVDINDSEGIKLRLLAKHENGGTEEYPLDPLMWTVRNSDLAATGGYRTLSNNEDSKYHVPFETNGTVLYLQFQVGTDSAGGSPGKFNSVVYTLGNK